MISIRGNRITMKKGDTGIFSIPNIYMRDGETVAVLTIYDMLKAVDKRMSVEEVYLISKDGGKSGHFER